MASSDALEHRSARSLGCSRGDWIATISSPPRAATLLDAGTTSLLGRIVALLERIAVSEGPGVPRIGSHSTRGFSGYVVARGMIAKLDHVRVRLADATESSLGDIKRRAKEGGVSIYFGTAQKQALNQIMQARGHIVALLSPTSFGEMPRRPISKHAAGQNRLME